MVVGEQVDILVLEVMGAAYQMEAMEEVGEVDEEARVITHHIIAVRAEA